MKKSYQRLIIFDIILAIILLLNGFILNILGNYYYMDIFLIILLILFRKIFGFEKDSHRYVKDIIINMVIIFLVAFICYYLLGIFVGFNKTYSYWNLYGIRTFLFPYTLLIIVREYLRYQMLMKADKSKILVFVTCLLFILLECSTQFASASFGSVYKVFIFISLTVLPIVSNNVVCTYIARKVGYKPNLFWLYVISLYSVVLPIIPNPGLYIAALIRFLFPFVLMYNVYSFFEARDRNVPISYVKKRVFIEMPALALLVFFLAYFVSGYFRYYAIAVATGSMLPNIKVGDVVVVDQKADYKKLEVGEVIAYKYGSVVVVHRLCNIVVVGNDYYFYTWGDANENMDNYIIYPDMILGRVESKVPYIGLPTVWLNKVFN